MNDNDCHYLFIPGSVSTEPYENSLSTVQKSPDPVKKQNRPPSFPYSCTVYSVQSVTRGQKEKTGPMIIVFKTKCTHSSGTYLRHIEISDLPITRRNRNVSAISVADTNQNAIRIRNQDSDKSDPDPNLY